jgi:hypothetical protein
MQIIDNASEVLQLIIDRFPKKINSARASIALLILSLIYITELYFT